MFKQLFSLTLLVTLSAVFVGCSEAGEQTQNKTNTPTASTQVSKTQSTASSSKSVGDWHFVEIKLVDDLGEPRGYCLDIAGGKGVNARLDKGIQAHTCYSEPRTEDQSFDPVLLKNGRLFINYFNICVAVESLNQGVGFNLEECGNSSKQKFKLQSNGNLVPKLRSGLCVTVSSKEKKEGQDVTRPLSLEPCTDDLKAYQTWATHRLSN